MNPGFLEKMIARLDRVEPGEVQGLITRLVRERGFLEHVFEALREGVILLDPEEHVTFLNRAAADFFGIDREHAPGQKLSTLVRGLDWPGLAQPGKVVSRDLEVFYPEPRHLNFYLAPIGGTGAEAEPTNPGFVMLVRDVTATRRETEETIESERLNALTLLAAGVAHEIGNPLNSLDIHLQLLNRKLKKLPPGDRPPLAEHLDTARAEIRRLDTILRQFLQAIRPTVPHREPHHLHAILHDTLKLLEPELANRGVKVALELDPGLPTLEIDADQFQQVFHNLLRNAYQALPGKDGRIDIRSRSTDYEVEVSITDNGTGISPESMGALFEPFRSTKQSGTGLGLLIVRRIVREHGGEIEIHSESGQGTRVAIHLPRRRRDARLLAEAPAPLIEVETT